MRDVTFIDDIVEGGIRVIHGAPEKKDGEDGLPIPPYAVYNIGSGTPENLLDYINTMACADSTALERDYGFTPRIGIREGLRKFAEWYREYYKV